jgi:folylpolyglutamate synthase/dihydropteroate synthase
LQAAVAARGRETIAAEPVSQAIERACALAGPDDLVCATGSLFVAAEARAAFDAPGSERHDPVPY